LATNWKQIASAAMLPILRVLYEQSSEGNYEFGELNDLALRRLYELAPEEGRRLIIAEMRRPDSRVGLQSFSVLPMMALRCE